MLRHLSTAPARRARGWLDATALVGGTTNDMTTIEWTEDRRLRAAYLNELEKALIELNPDRHPEPGSVLRWKFATTSNQLGGHMKWRDCYAKSGNGLVANYN